jgi:hypothetical protein
LEDVSGVEERVFSDRICFKVSFEFSPTVSKAFSLADSEGPDSILAWCFVVSALEAPELEDYIVSSTSKTLTILFL